MPAFSSTPSLSWACFRARPRSPGNRTGRLASTGARFVRENLTIDRMVEEHEKLYREILTGRR